MKATLYSKDKTFGRRFIRTASGNDAGLFLLNVASQIPDFQLIYNIHTTREQLSSEPHAPHTFTVGFAGSTTYEIEVAP